MPEQRVYIHYFPKRPKRDARPISEESAARTTLEFRPVFPEPAEIVTEPAFVPPAEDRRREPARKKKGRKRDGRAATPPRSRTPIVEPTEATLRYQKDRMAAILESPDPVKSLRGMTRAQLGEMALLGHRLFEAGNFHAARVVFEGLVGFGVEDAFPHTMLGTVYLALGDQDRAIALFEAALRFDPKDVAARVYRGEIRLNRGKLKQALEDLRYAVDVGAADDPFIDRAKRLVKIAHELGRKKK